MDAGYLRLGHGVSHYKISTFTLAEVRGGSFQQNYTYLLRINSSMIPITR